MAGLGALINAAGIVIGGFFGLLFGNLLKEKQQEALCKACGLCVLFISVAGAMEGMLSIDEGLIKSGKAMFIVVCVALGTLFGEFADLEKQIERFGEWLKKRTGNSGDKNFVNGFLNASFTVCIGAMAIVGSIQDGLTGNRTTLLVKTLLDFIIVAVMASTMGKGCLFSAIPVLLFEGTISLLAKLISPIMTEEMLNAVSLVGSLLIFCVGVNLVWDKKFRVANMLPAVLLAAIASFFVK